MKHIKTYKLFESDTLTIPDDVAVWFANYYVEPTYLEKPAPKIPPKLVSESKDYLDEMTKGGWIYRGFGLNHKSEPGVFVNTPATKPNFNSNKRHNEDLKYNRTTSWSFDKETAFQFAENAANEGMIPAIARMKFKDIGKLVCMDIVMENIPTEQAEMLFKKTVMYNFINYVSESEIVVFDKLVVPAKNITVLV